MATTIPDQRGDKAPRPQDGGRRGADRAPARPRGSGWGSGLGRGPAGCSPQRPPPRPPLRPRLHLLRSGQAGPAAREGTSAGGRRQCAACGAPGGRPGGGRGFSCSPALAGRRGRSAISSVARTCALTGDPRVALLALGDVFSQPRPPPMPSTRGQPWSWKRCRSLWDFAYRPPPPGGPPPGLCGCARLEGCGGRKPSTCVRS